MKKTKQLVCVILTLAMALSMFTACGSSKTGETIEATVQTTPAETVPQISEEASQQAPAAEVSAAVYALGDKVEDFTVTTHDGKEISLYELLEQKDMVLLNFWATWCTPCAMEFPALEEAYQQYKDQVGIVAISVEPRDTADVIADYAAEKGLTFPMAPNSADLVTQFSVESYPTSVVIDRFGTVCLNESGSKPDSEVFTNLFDRFIGDDYTESILLPSMEAELPTVEPASSEELSKALDSDLIFTNSPNAYYWPMTVAEKEGKTVLVSENSTTPGTVSVLNTTVEAKAGDAIVITFKMGADSPKDLMTLSVNGQAMKHFGSTRDWGTYTHTFGKDGTYDVSITYTKDSFSYDEDAFLWIDSIQLLSGDEAAAALEQNPQYLVSPEISIQLLNEDAKSIVLYREAEPEVTDQYYILDDVWNVKVTLDETVDPELAYYQNNYGEGESLLRYQKEDGYYIPFTPWEGALLPIMDICMGDKVATLCCLTSEEHADQLCDVFSDYYGEAYGWRYEEKTSDAVTVTGDVTYTVTYTDQNGDPVPGVMCQVCDEATCQVFVSGPDGVCSITLPAGIYEIHTLKVPEGYEGDTTTITDAPVGGGELSFQLTKK